MKRFFLIGLCFFSLIFSATVSFSKGSGSSAHGASAGAKSAPAHAHPAPPAHHANAGPQSEMEGSVSAGLAG